MKRKNNMWKAVIAVVVALAVVLPGSYAFANVETIGVTSSSENTNEIKNMVESTMDEGYTSLIDDRHTDASTENEESMVDDGYTDALDPSEPLTPDSTSEPITPFSTSEPMASDSTSNPDVINRVDSIPLLRGIVYVDDDQIPEWYDATHVHTITQGVTAAIAGDMVYVYNGTYNDHVTVNKRLNLVGESRNNVIVNGGGSGNVFYITTPVTGVNISTFTIANGQYSIRIASSSNNRIMDCNVYGNTKCGIYLVGTGCSNNVLMNCNAYGNTNNGIFLEGASNNVIMNCTAYNNNCGIGLYKSSYNTIMNCVIYDINSHGIFLSTYSSYNIIAKCNIYGSNFDGIYISGALGDSLHNIIANCDVHDTAYYGICLSVSVDNVVTNCSAYNNQYGFYLSDISNTVIANCTAYNNTDYDLNSTIRGYGYWIYGSDNNIITDCTAYNNTYGFELIRSSNNKLRGNTIYDNSYNFGISGTTTIAHFIHDIDTSNTVNGKPIFYFYDASNIILDETDNIGYLGLVSCTNITAKNLEIYGIMIADTTYSTLSNVSSNSGIYGIYLVLSSYNVIANCSAYDNQYGFYLCYYSSYNVIKDCTISNNNYGVHIYIDSNNNNITNCTAYNNNNGINLERSSNNKLRGNTIYDNSYNFGISGTTTIAHFIHDIDTSNTVNGKPIFYFYDASNIILDETDNIGYLGLVSCTNITAKNLEIYGIMIADTTYSTLSNVSSNSGIYGVYLFQSSYDVITDCTIHNNRFGFYLYYYSSYNVITNCSAYDNQYGFYLRYSSYNVITGCTIFNNNYGVYIYTDSKSNAIYHNDFINNTYNAKDPYSNIWDNGYPSGGNYWSDYTGVDNYSGPDQDIPGSDGIGDTPYCIPGWGILGGSNQDQYPLMNPIGTDVIPPVTTATLEGNHSGDVYISDVKVTLTATDFGSGVNYTLYKLNSNAWITYTAPFIVSANGTHVVSFYSVDIAGNRETEKSCTFTIQQEVPSVNITIKGGLGISATITNNGAIDLTNVDWMISLDGGLIFFGKTKSGIITTLPAGESVTVRDFVIGFGKTMVTVTVTCVDSSDTAKQEAFVFLFFIR